ncbi:MAG: excisionase family DNA-binding protein [Desulfobacteraceae bacterium]|nr:excisionase family DNA-binding protein [Desulfobacteraceae bacterium]
MDRHTDQLLNKTFLTVSEAARYMGVGKKIIYQLIEFGEIEAARKRGAVLVNPASVDAFRNSGKLT